MKTEKSNSSDPLPPEQSEWHEVETQIQQLEQALQELKQRLANVRAMQNERARLKEQQHDLRSQLQGSPASPQLKQQLKQDLAQISSQLDLLEVDLESRLISWSSFREPFWQIVRFGGLGVLIGFAIKSCTG
ncbi:hypothetical protein [Pseudanabaena sp. PCC 6802]|uniref:hypothetical protein n=1 Tax=Pseudanabaena sp. PCC 6802 TaxID=118173 RepID=UPI0003490993|nr:hypothetical protein [Pseudanabaena sp. PCC 6802]